MNNETNNNESNNVKMLYVPVDLETYEEVQRMYYKDTPLCFDNRRKLGTPVRQYYSFLFMRGFRMRKNELANPLQAVRE